MKIYYQWAKWAYSNIAANKVWSLIGKSWLDLTWLDSFNSVWKKIEQWNIWILPIENSYAGSIHENLYNFLRFNCKIISEINLPVRHVLLSKEENISEIKEIYSHPQAISQCYSFLKKHWIKSIEFNDTAWAAKMISDNDLKWVWAIASDLAWDIYWLNKLESNIQDHDFNTTRFFIITNSDSDIQSKKKIWKISLIFETRDIPAVLYKCLWAFATSSINLSKIESVPSLGDPFTYFFWLDFEWYLDDPKVKWSLSELAYFTKSVKILWEY